MKISIFKRVSRVLAAIAALAALASSADAAPIKILALGTSLTQGYGLPPGTEFTIVLQEKLKSRRALMR